MAFASHNFRLLKNHYIFFEKVSNSYFIFHRVSSLFVLSQCHLSAPWGVSAPPDLTGCIDPGVVCPAPDNENY